MSLPTHQQEADVATLNMLTEYIINAYRPGDVILIATSQPASFCIGHQDLVIFLGGYLFWVSFGGGCRRCEMFDESRFPNAFPFGHLKNPWKSSLLFSYLFSRCKKMKKLWTNALFFSSIKFIES
jgi:hypothetical protein